MVKTDPVFHDGNDDYERAKIIAASGSGGSAQGRPPQAPGTLRFGEARFEGDDGSDEPVLPMQCTDGQHHGRHVWLNAVCERCVCEGFANNGLAPQ